MSQIWDNLCADPQVDDHVVKRLHRRFVVESIPAILADQLKAPVTPAALMKAQYAIVQSLASVKSDGQTDLEALAADLSHYRDAEGALQRAGYSPRDFYRKLPGFTDDEITRVEAGQLTIGDVLLERPAVLLRPLLIPRQH